MTRTERLRRIRTRTIKLSHDEIFRLDRMLSERFDAEIASGQRTLYHMDEDIFLLAAIKGARDN